MLFLSTFLEDVRDHDAVQQSPILGSPPDGSEAFQACNISPLLCALSMNYIAHVLF